VHVLRAIWLSCLLPSVVAAQASTDDAANAREPRRSSEQPSSSSPNEPPSADADRPSAVSDPSASNPAPGDPSSSPESPPHSPTADSPSADSPTSPSADSPTSPSADEPSPSEPSSSGESRDECLRPAVRIRYLRRHREATSLSFTHCDGTPNLDAVDPLSVVARAFRTARPSDQEIAAFRAEHPERAEHWLTPTHRRMHPGLLVRLQAIADRFPERELVVVSGHRPRARRGSRHRYGRALDIQVEGVPRAEVAAFARTLADTGVGYYPNSTFTHVDVRSRQVYWVDRSGPGEAPDYGPWPPTHEESRATRDEVLASIQATLDEGAFTGGEAPADPEDVRERTLAAIDRLRRRDEPLPPATDDEVDWDLPDPSW